MVRLNTGISSKIHTDESFQKLIGWTCRELEMMKNDNHMTCQVYNFEIENRLLNFCVGMCVGGTTITHRPCEFEPLGQMESKHHMMRE